MLASKQYTKHPFIPRVIKVRYVFLTIASAFLLAPSGSRFASAFHPLID